MKEPLPVPPDSEVIRIIARNDIQALFTAEADGEWIDLGEHRDFRRNPLIKSFMPEEGRTSLSWTKLRPSQSLANHVHPKKSMILVCKGKGRLTGDLEADLNEGDAVLIPGGCVHGFTADESQALDCLSIQFEGDGLYERESLVKMKSTPTSDIMGFCQDRLARHLSNPFFKLLANGTLESIAARTIFERALNCWSAKFQLILHARAVFSRNPRFSTIFRQHLREELDHDLLIKVDVKEFWDPIIDSCAEWFVSSMATATDLERLTIVHLVLETSGHAFYDFTSRCHELLNADNAEYYQLHSLRDDDHQRLGESLFSDITANESKQLKLIASRAWDVLDVLLERIATLTLGA